MFDGAPKEMVDWVIRVVKLIRSKGAGIFFITQSPADLPDAVLAQLNNRIQHALRAYTPAEQKAIRVAAQSFRPNPAFKTEDAISTMGTGVALVSTLDADGAPTPVEKTTICPPQSAFTPLSDAARAMMVGNDPLFARYREAVDAPSAYEMLAEQATAEQQAEEEQRRLAQAEKEAAAQAKQQQRAMDQWEKSLQRAGRSITRSVLGNRSAASRAAGSFAGQLMGDLLTGFFK